MGNIAYYLKYRPQALPELIGQESVKKTLLSSFEENRLSHAYLFVGPRGTGKTSTARILAKMVNCPAKQNVPCNECEVCISITDGSNMDLIEIDAASNRGIEDIRSLREKIKLSPTSLKKKVYIIDEAHMLTTEAFNALLKTLEEPPAHALFILATTELGKIPQTILSRVQRLDFKLAAQDEILEVFEKIINKEKINIEPEALKVLVKRAEGSFRDGVKLLDQISSGKGKITVEALQADLKSTRFDELLDLVKNVSGRNSAKSLLNVSKQMEQGIDTRELITSLMDFLRSLTLIKNGVGEELVKPQFSEDKYKEMM
ncbi:MAG: DNA polymerase III subunit gamma/tau, partial [Candidatus Daviesbacteria bacterium]|nr:DNA polymerase III subunit gamma/tau [Candidatus Daviesbacteria bacterium]